MNIFQPIISFLRWAARELSRADGREGLALSDIESIVQWVRLASEARGADGQPLPGLRKNEEVAARIVRVFGDRIHPATARILTWAAWLIAKRLKII